MNQIDPGQGYRIFYRDEPLQDGIQYWSEHKQCWLPRPEPSWVLSPTDTYRIAVDPSQRYRITGTGSNLDGQIVEVVEWGENHCLVGSQVAQTWIARRCLEAITDHLVNANKKVEPTVKQPLVVDPGEGWRLLDKSEMPQKGDECLGFDGKWLESENWITGCRQADTPYRRRIESEPVVKQSLTTEYIEPTMEHVGQMVEVRDGNGRWFQDTLLAVLPALPVAQSGRFVTYDRDCKMWMHWQQARVKPEPKPEPKYRKVTPNDIGKEIQVRDCDWHDWVDCSLLRIVWITTHDDKGTQGVKTYVCNLGQTWAQARIVDGGEA
jgi:hypothetical protein